jgi:hypothetical protein
MFFWAKCGHTRISKDEGMRQKDLADIFRLVESYPYPEKLLPEKIREKF